MAIGNGTGCRTAAIAASLLLTIGGYARCEPALYDCGTSAACLVYAITAVLQLHHGGDMMREIRRRKPEPTLLPTRRIFNLPHHTGMT